MPESVRGASNVNEFKIGRSVVNISANGKSPTLNYKVNSSPLAIKFKILNLNNQSPIRKL